MEPHRALSGSFKLALISACTTAICSVVSVIGWVSGALFQVLIFVDAQPTESKQRVNASSRNGVGKIGSPAPLPFP
jgi:hypothetical protein